MVKHLCEICGKNFSEREFFDALERAREHEKIPVDEGDYHGLVIRDKFPMPHYRLLVKSDKISEEHERMYDTFSIYDNGLSIRSIAKSAEGYEKDSIDYLLETGEWEGLNEKSLFKLVRKLDKRIPSRSYSGQKVDEYKTI